MDTAFLDELASGSPTPGGGGAAAYGGALAAALASMVCHLTIGKKRYADVEPQMEEALSRLTDLRRELEALVEADARAFAPLSDAYRMPKATPGEARAKEAALQAALKDATEVPLSIMEACARVISELGFLQEEGSRLALSDVGCAALFADAALQAANMNVRINVSSLADEDKALAYERKADGLLRAGRATAQQVAENVMKEL